MHKGKSELTALEHRLLATVIGVWLSEKHLYRTLALSGPFSIFLALTTQQNSSRKRKERGGQTPPTPSSPRSFVSFELSPTSSFFETAGQGRALSVLLLSVFLPLPFHFQPSLSLSSLFPRPLDSKCPINQQVFPLPFNQNKETREGERGRGRKKKRRGRDRERGCVCVSERVSE